MMTIEHSPVSLGKAESVWGGISKPLQSDTLLPPGSPVTVNHDLLCLVDGRPWFSRCSEKNTSR